MDYKGRDRASEFPGGISSGRSKTVPLVLPPHPDIFNHHPAHHLLSAFLAPAHMAPAQAFRFSLTFPRSETLLVSAWSLIG
jgi:hypothetical protein